MINGFAVLALGLVLPALTFADDWNKHFDVSGNPELHVTAGDAAVRIHRGSGSGIDASVKTKGLTIGESGVRVEAHQSGNRVELDIRMPQEHFHWGNNRSVEVEIGVPEHIEAFLRTGDGPITLEDLSGSVHAQTGDGPVRVEHFDGSLEAQTGDGPVNVTGKFAELQIHTGDGPVDVRAESGSHLQSGWHLYTGDGPVQIHLPATLSADVSLHTGDGPISMRLPLASTGEQNKHSMHGKLNGGGPELSVHTGDGPISIGQS
jgi:hypothetical protein